MITKDEDSMDSKIITKDGPLLLFKTIEIGIIPFLLLGITPIIGFPLNLKMIFTSKLNLFSDKILKLPNG